LGACGVQMGTAFLTTSECPIHPAYKSAIQNQDGDNTAITKVFSGGAARGIMNQFMLDNNAHEILPFPFHNALTKPFRKVANDLGQIQYTNLWSGQAGRLARQMSIEELLQTLWREVDDAKAR
jgi:nitronate monooxygenase